MEARFISNIYPTYKNVIEADKYAKRLIENAVYMELCKDYTVCFYPLGSEEELDFNSFICEIEGNYYHSIMTNKHSELIYFYEKEIQEKGYEQIALF